MRQFLLPDNFVDETWNLTDEEAMRLGSEVKYFLRLDIDQWFKDNGIDYMFKQYRVKPLGLYEFFIDIESDVDALQFKLTFGI